MEVRYSRRNLDSMNEIGDLRFEKFMLNMITIILASFSMLLIIIFSALYLHSKRKDSKNLIETLIEK